MRGRRSSELDWRARSAPGRPPVLMQPVPREGALVLWHLLSSFGGCYRITSLTWCLPVLPWYGLGSPSLSGSFTGIDLSGDSWDGTHISSVPVWQDRVHHL